MPKRPPLALPRDVLRIYDAQDSMDRLSNADLDLIQDAIDDVSSDFEVQTNHAFRLTRRGSLGTPSTYDYAGIDGDHHRPPVRVNLGHRYVRPFDSAEGDVLQYRSGRDEWTGITDEAGDEFTLHYKSGRLKVWRWLIQQIMWDIPDERYIRASYRYGALGGDQTEGGQTTLDGSLGGNSSDTSVSVGNAGHLVGGGTVLIYGDNAEYVDIESVDYDTDTLTVSRGERSTEPQSHSDGDVVHFCPGGVRMAMAGKAAQEAQLYELFTDRLVDTGDGISFDSRAQTWADQYDRLLASYAGVRKF